MVAGCDGINSRYCHPVFCCVCKRSGAVGNDRRRDCFYCDGLRGEAGSIARGAHGGPRRGRGGAAYFGGALTEVADAASWETIDALGKLPVKTGGIYKYRLHIHRVLIRLRLTSVVSSSTSFDFLRRVDQREPQC